jgi:long-chain acyl-CoA synthetase
MHVYVCLQLTRKIDENDVLISYLPLAHIFERGMQAFMWTRGVAVGFYRGNVLELLADMQELR